MELKKKNSQSHLISGILSLVCNFLAILYLISYCQNVAADTEAIASSFVLAPVFALLIGGGFLLGKFAAKELKFGVFGIRISLFQAILVTLLLLCPYFGLWDFVYNFSLSVTKASEFFSKLQVIR